MKFLVIIAPCFMGCLLAGCVAGQGGSDLRATALRCEYRHDPIGIDVKEPRLTWLLQAEARGQSQSAYQVLAASTEDLLAKDEGDLWDSGRVDSDATTDIVYEGKPLAAHQSCFWKVRIWDKDGKPSAWSKPAVWRTGAERWSAPWVGYDKYRKVEPHDADFGTAKWVGFAADKPLQAPKAPRVFMTTLEIPAGCAIEKAELLVAADDSCRFTINGEVVMQIKAWNQPRSIDIRQHLKAGVNTVRVQVDNGAPGPMGLLAKLTVILDNGKTIKLVTDEKWRCTDKPGAYWHNRDIAADAWPACKVLGDYGIQPWGKLKLMPLILPPAVQLRGGFNADKPVRSAVAYATALGIFDLYVNGKRVSDDFFNPGWTDYTKRVYYRAYDVTSQVKQGANVIGAILADGWYSGYVGYGNNRDHYGNRPRFSAMVHVTYEDGSAADFASGPDWKASAGPIVEADFLMGETYDARKEMPGWCTTGFDASKWDKVDVGAELSPVVQAHPAPPVEVFEQFKTVMVTQPRPGAYVLDMGQNFAGVPRLKIKGQPGQKIVLRFAERLNPDGTIYTTNLRSARATDTYICKGGDEEIWTPRFTFHGFQYIEVTGLQSAPTPDTVVGLAISSQTPVAGAFSCSDPMLNRLHKNIYYTQRMNFIDIPTDCPQRDERLGWTGDAQVYIRTATLNTDVQAFFNKWLVDLADGQRADGQFPMVAPVKVAGDDGGPAWADAGVICPWIDYEVYGDKKVLARQYPSMKKFIEFCKNRSTTDLLAPAKYHCFGDWLSIKADTPKDIIYTAYFAQSARLTARAAEVLGQPDEAAYFDDLYKKIRQSFNKAFVKSDGRIGLTDKDGKFQGNTQTCYVLAIAFDLLDQPLATAAAKYLVEDIRSRDWHLSTGFIGTKDLMLALAKIGRNDVAYRLLHNETFPSWGFSIKHGATSIWERWDGWTPENGFQTPGMNSFAHYSFGAVYQWMAENIGGIRSDGPAYKKIIIAPQPGGKLTQASVTYDSIRGRIQSAWKLDGERLALVVTIPPNTTAVIRVPAKDSSAVTESGKPLAGLAGVTLLPAEPGVAVVEVGSGTYEFASTCRPILPVK